MNHLIDAVTNSVNQRNWYSALALALTLPDICARLEDPRRRGRQPYLEWWTTYLLPKYQKPIGKDKHIHTFLSAEDMYALRCAFLHQGGDDINDQEVQNALTRFHFTAPPRTGMVHMNQHGSALQLQIDMFCCHICEGVGAWMADNKDNAEIQTRMATLAVVHEA